MCGTASRRFRRIYRDADQLRSRAGERLHLLSGALDVRRIGVRHRLHDDGRGAADADGADGHLYGFATLDGGHGTCRRRASWDRPFYMVECAHPIIGLSGESPATAGTPKAQAPPGNAQAHERQIAGALESGGRLGGHPPKGSGAVGARSLRSQDRGRQGHRMPAVHLLSGAPVTRHTPLSTCTRSSAPGWSTSAAGTCRCSTARRSRSTMPSAAPPVSSTSRTCVSSTSRVHAHDPSCKDFSPTTSAS